MIPAMLDGGRRAEATLGVICGAAEGEWGIYASRPLLNRHKSDGMVVPIVGSCVTASPCVEYLDDVRL
jgi:hypothetical protein